MDERFAEVYYKPEHLWTGNKAIRKLHKETGLSKRDAKSWLGRQAFWQVHIPSPKSINHPHYEITNPMKCINLTLFMYHQMWYMAPNTSTY